jgi:hypothetical protein
MTMATRLSNNNKRPDSSNRHPELGKRGMLGIPQHLLPIFFGKFDLKRPLPNKVHELLIGYILVQFLKEDQKQSAIIGFPVTEGWEKRCGISQITLEWLLEHCHQIVDDADVDIQIFSCGLTTKYQITRFVYPHGQRPIRRLAELIKKKCQQPTDSSLNLLISVERTPEISRSELQNLVTSKNIPIIHLLLRRASNKLGHFSIIQIYPKLVVGKEVKIQIPV